MQTFTDKNLPKHDLLYPILKTEIAQTADIIAAIQPSEISRKKRAFNIIGTAWKYIAGSPDHDDFEMIKNDFNQLNGNNNRQVVINEALTTRINKLSDITNNISKVLARDEKIIDATAVNMQSRLRLVKEELVNIKYAIQWAKRNILNTMLLNKNEIKLALEKLNEENMLFASTEEALEYSNVKILYKNSTLLYVIQIPLTLRENYVNIMLKTVKKNNKMINLKFKEVLKHKEELFGITEYCKTVNKIKICKREQIVNISNDTCIPRILKSINSSCSFTNNLFTPNLERISSDIILLNDFNGTVNNISIQGTYLIKYHNSTINIDGDTYRNLESSPLILIPQTLQLSPIEKEVLSVLSLETLNQLHLNNTHKINMLNVENTFNKYFTLTTTLLLLSLLIIFKILCKPKQKIMFQTTIPTIDALNQTNPTTNFINQVPLKINNLPYF